MLRAGLIALAILVLPAPASAASLVTETGSTSRWQAVADSSRAPTVDARVVVLDAPCAWPGFEGVWGCTILDDDVRVHLSPEIPLGERRMTLWHELGHLYSTGLLEADRAGFRAVVGARAEEEWERGEDSLEERFAVAYSVAARYGDAYSRLHRAGPPPTGASARARWRRAVVRSRRFRSEGQRWEHGYVATPATNAAVLRLLRAVAAR